MKAGWSLRKGGVFPGPSAQKTGLKNLRRKDWFKLTLPCQLSLETRFSLAKLAVEDTKWYPLFLPSALRAPLAVSCSNGGDLGSQTGVSEKLSVPAEVQQFSEEVSNSINCKMFFKATLSRYRGDETELCTAHLKLIDIKEGPRLQVTFRYKSKDIVKNFEISVTSTVVTDLICRGFKTANLYTMSGDWQLNIPKKPAKPIRLTRSKPALSTYPKAEHDKNKTWEVSPDAPFLQELGLTGFVPGKSRAFCRLKLENN
mmetsp:Transcript_40573/g.96400  ORF Transcript_40573/g.96400 Transcript_40573/m.96400 type:complete len:257 (-) Transcript_40573:1436-2206(-)